MSVKRKKTSALIEILKKWVRPGSGGEAPDLANTDYDGWRQTEAQYQAEQAAWLAQVKHRKKEKRSGNERRP